MFCMWNPGEKQLAQHIQLVHDNSRRFEVWDAPIAFTIAASGTSTCVGTKRVETSSAISLTATKFNGIQGLTSVQCMKEFVTKCEKCEDELCLQIASTSMKREIKMV
jgi:hypothetical protein